jgi:hypothetical protein
VTEKDGDEGSLVRKLEGKRVQAVRGRWWQERQTGEL